MLNLEILFDFKAKILIEANEKMLVKEIKQKVFEIKKIPVNEQIFTYNNQKM